MKPKTGEFWWYRWGKYNIPEVGKVVEGKIYGTGDEEGHPFSDVYEFIKRIPRPRSKNETNAKQSKSTTTCFNSNKSPTSPRTSERSGTDRE